MCVCCVPGVVGSGDRLASNNLVIFRVGFFMFPAADRAFKPKHVFVGNHLSHVLSKIMYMEGSIDQL